MFNINIDTREIRRMSNKISGLKRRINLHIENYLQLLLGHGGVSVKGKLKKNINILVYEQSEEPDFYERTYSLFNAVRVEKIGNEIHLYIDDEWLSNRPHVRENSMRTGNALNAGSNAQTPYSIRVEEDFIYHNPYFDTERTGSGYMRATFNELFEDIMAGDKRADQILEPILGSWNK